MKDFPGWLKLTVRCAGKERLTHLCEYLQKFRGKVLPEIVKKSPPRWKPAPPNVELSPLERILHYAKTLWQSRTILEIASPSDSLSDMQETICEMVGDLGTRPSKGHAYSMPDERVPVLDVLAASAKKLGFLMSLFSAVWDKGDLAKMPQDDLIELLLPFVPHVLPDTLAPSVKAKSSRCFSCSTRLHFWKKVRNCFACSRLFCAPCARRRFRSVHCPLLLDRSGAKHDVCDDCRTRFCDQAKAWLGEALQLIGRQSASSLYAANACLHFACCLDKSVVNPLQIAKELNEAGFHDLSIVALLPVVEPLVSCRQKKPLSMTARQIRSLLFFSSVLRLIAEKNDQLSDDDRICYLCSAKESLTVLDFGPQAATNVDIVVNVAKETTEIDDLIRAAHEKRRQKRESRVAEKRRLLDSAWESREWDKLWRLAIAPPDDDDSRLGIESRNDSVLEALDRFIAQKIEYVDRMTGEDQAGLRFLAGVAKINNGNYSESLIDIEKAVWSGHHSDWLPAAASKVFIAVCTIPKAADVIGHQTLYQNCSQLTAENLVSSASISKLSECGLLPDTSMLFPPSFNNRVWCDFSFRSSKTAFKYELGIQKNFVSGKWSHRDVALAYIDFLPACCHTSEIVVTLLMAASWFLKELHAKVKTTAFHQRNISPEVYALKQIIVQCIACAHQSSLRYLHPGMRFYVLRLGIGMAIHAINLANENFTESDSQLIVKMLHMLVYNARFCPFWRIPVVGISEAILLHIVSGQIHSEFVLALQNVKSAESCPIDASEINYQIYENDLLHVSKLVSSEDAYERCVDVLLKARQWTWEDVSDTMTSPLLARTPDGWLIQEPKFAVDLDYAELLGFEIDFSSNSPSFRLLVKKPDGKNVGLFSESDVAEAIRLNEGEPIAPSFSLDPPSIYEHFHPFQELRYPDEIRETGLLKTMLEADYLMKSFSVGSDVSSKPPFKRRPTIIGDSSGLLDNVPRHIRSILSPLSHGQRFDRLHRFWIQADELVYEKELNSDDSKLVWYFKQPKMTVRTSPMIHDVDGKLIDFPKMDPDSPEVKFAADMTTNYDEIGVHFPIFLRLRELVKLYFVGRIIFSVYEGLKERERNGVDESILAKMVDEHWTNACDQIAKGLRQLRADIESKGDVRATVDAMIEERVGAIVSELERNTYAYDVDFRGMSRSDLDEYVRRLVREDFESKGGVAAIIKGRREAIVSELVKACDLPVSRSDLDDHVRRWLDSGYDKSLAEFICRHKKPTRDELRKQCIDHIREQYRKAREDFERERNAIVRNGSSCAFRWKSKCQWVPAALHNDPKSSWLCYGGVLLGPKYCEGTVPRQSLEGTESVLISGTNAYFMSQSSSQSGKAFVASTHPAVSNEFDTGNQYMTILVLSDGKPPRISSPPGGDGDGNDDGGGSGNGDGGGDGNGGGGGDGNGNSFKPITPKKLRKKPTDNDVNDVEEKGYYLYSQNGFGKVWHMDHVVELQVLAWALKEALSNEFCRLGQEGVEELQKILVNVFNSSANLVWTWDTVNWAKGGVTRTCINSLVHGHDFDMGAQVRKMEKRNVEWSTLQNVWLEHFCNCVVLVWDELQKRGEDYQADGERVLDKLRMFGSKQFSIDVNLTQYLMSRARDADTPT